MGRLLKQLIILILLTSVPASAAILRVPGDYGTIQAAIDAAVGGDTVIVADGFFFGPGNKNLDFRGKGITVRSENGPEHTTLILEDSGRAFHFHSGEGRDAVVLGFTIKDGHVPDKGGAIMIENGASPMIVDNIIINNVADTAAGAIYIKDSSPVISNNVISGNASTNNGGAISMRQSAPKILNNVVSNNTSQDGAGIYYIFVSSPLIANNLITGNTATRDGGGLFNYGGTAMVLNNLITGNTAGNGGGIWCKKTAPLIKNNIVINNTAVNGGGVYCLITPSPTFLNNLVAMNTADNGGGLFCDIDTVPVFIQNTVTGNTANNTGGALYCLDSDLITVSNAIFWGNTAPEIFVKSGNAPAVTYSNVQGGYPGTGNIDNDPRFTPGPLGDYYLSHIASGQAEDSPCIDAGNPAGPLLAATTRTDSVKDTGIPDMGFHPPLLSVLAGAGPAFANTPTVRVFPSKQDAAPDYEFDAYGPRHYGVNVAAGDVTGDGLDEVITGAGPGNVFGPHVRGFQVDGRPLPGLNFLAYGTPRFGVNVSAGDVNGDGIAEILTAPGPGPVFAPHIRGFHYDGTAVTPLPAVNFIAYGTRRWGANVSGGDVDGDGFAEIMTGPGPGAIFGPNVRGWNSDGGRVEPIPGINYFAYSARSYGAVVSCGDLDGDGTDEIVTAPGPDAKYGAHVKGWRFDGSAVSALPGFSFFAWAPFEGKYGAKIFAGADLDGDGKDDLVAGTGPDPSARSLISVFNYNGSGKNLLLSLTPFEPSWTEGVTVAAGRF
jgi:hypothetical protein